MSEPPEPKGAEGRDSRQHSVGVFLGNQAVFGHFPGFSAVVDHPVIPQQPLEPLLPGLEDTVGAGSGRQDGQAVAGQLGLEHGILFQESRADRQRLLLAVGGVGREHNAQDFGLVSQALVPLGHLEHQRIGRKVPLVGLALAVVTLMPRVQRQDGGVGVFLPPFPPAGGHDGN